MIKLSQPIISEEEIKAVADVLRSGMLVQGQNVEKFEQLLEEYMDTQFVVAVSSGTAALHIALAALEIGENDAVFVPGFTFPATANVVEIQKARTVLVEVDPYTYNMDPAKLEEAIINYKGNEKPKAIIVVHEFGAPANMTRIMEIAKKYHLFVVEDAACALGTTWSGQHVGTFGDIGCFSWHPRKAITTGEGGAAVTNNEHLNKKMRLLRNHGLNKSDDGSMDFILPGFNYRLTDIQAVLGIHQLKNFNSWVKKRCELVECYYKLLENCPNVQLPNKTEGHAWQTFMVVLSNEKERNSIINHLKMENIESNIGAQALHLLYYYKNKYGYKSSDYPIAQKLFENGLALPLHPLLNYKDIENISFILKKILT